MATDFRRQEAAISGSRRQAQEAGDRWYEIAGGHFKYNLIKQAINPTLEFSDNSGGVECLQQMGGINILAPFGVGMFGW